MKQYLHTYLKKPLSFVMFGLFINFRLKFTSNCKFLKQFYLIRNRVAMHNFNICLLHHLVRRKKLQYFASFNVLSSKTTMHRVQMVTEISWSLQCGHLQLHNCLYRPKSNPYWSRVNPKSLKRAPRTPGLEILHLDLDDNLWMLDNCYTCSRKTDSDGKQVVVGVEEDARC